MSADQAPGRVFDGFAELKFAIGELHHLAVRLGVILAVDDNVLTESTWDASAWRALDLYERTLADIGELSGKYVKLIIANRQI